MWFRRKQKVDPAEVSRELRAQALGLEATAAGFTPSEAHPHVWGIVMETGYPEAVATLVAFLDGTTSMYFSSGGGVIGAGEHESVRKTLPQFFAAAEAHRGELAQATSTPLPAEGRVRFYLRTFNGTLTAEAAEEDLGEMRHALSPFFHAGHEVIAAIRHASGG
jgi:hypothetical protein